MSLDAYNECASFYFSIVRDEAGNLRLSLTLWQLLPRKGASRGYRVESIAHEDMPAVKKYLRQAAERNAARFAKVF
jgi:hypothetical protein